MGTWKSEEIFLKARGGQQKRMEIDEMGFGTNDIKKESYMSSSGTKSGN